MFRKPLTWGVLAVVGLAAAFAAYWFAPWKLFTDRTVDEALSSPVPLAATPAGVASSAPTTGPFVLKQGTFVAHEHATTGTVRIIQLPDGTSSLEIAGLSTSDGPDLRVWLTDQPVRAETSNWRVFDDGLHLELGKLKGNRGNQVYPIPASADLGAYRSVTIWCIRFSVSFGAASLT
jgi:Electron transfer DM13